MQLAEPFIHHASENQRKPVKGRGENAKQSRHPHNQVEMSDHKVGVVKVRVNFRLSEEEAGQPAGHEERNESKAKKAWTS